MEKKENKIDWTSVLGSGESSAISADELTRRLGFRDKRQTRSAVMAARMDGMPICSLQNGERTGYFLADANKPEEIQHTMNELKKRAFSTLKQVSRLNKWMMMHGCCGINEQMSIADFIQEESREKTEQKASIKRGIF